MPRASTARAGSVRPTASNISSWSCPSSSASSDSSLPQTQMTSPPSEAARSRTFCTC